MTNYRSVTQLMDRLFSSLYPPIKHATSQCIHHQQLGPYQAIQSNPKNYLFVSKQTTIFSFNSTLLSFFLELRCPIQSPGPLISSSSSNLQVHSLRSTACLAIHPYPYRRLIWCDVASMLKGRFVYMPRRMHSLFGWLCPLLSDHQEGGFLLAREAQSTNRRILLLSM